MASVIFFYVLIGDYSGFGCTSKLTRIGSKYYPQRVEDTGRSSRPKEKQQPVILSSTSRKLQKTHPVKTSVCVFVFLSFYDTFFFSV